MEQKGRKRGLFSVVLLWEQRSLQEGCIFADPVTRAVCSFALFEEYTISDCILYSPGSYGRILSYFYILRIGERCLFCPRTSLPSQCPLLFVAI